MCRISVRIPLHQPNFESAVSTEALARVIFFPRLKAALDGLPPKLVDIGTDPPTAVREVDDGGEGAGPRIQRARAAIAAATFTNETDKPVVLELYNDYITSIGNAMNAAGEVDAGGEYTGERNPAGEMEGHGVFRNAAGDCYEGQWRGGSKQGHGTYFFADGAMYVGDYEADLKHGRGTFRWADGARYEGDWWAGKQHGRGTCLWEEGALVSRYEFGSPVGDGAQWSADRLRAWRLADGEEAEEISLEEATRIAVAVGEPVPGPSTWRALEA